MKSTTKKVLLIVGVLAVALLAYHGASRPFTDSAHAAEPTPRTVHDLSLSFTSVARAMKPCVVSIRSEKVLEGTSGMQGMAPFLPDDMLRRFFGDEFRHVTPPTAPREEFRQSGVGSGVIVSKDGYVLTNNHVIAGADEVTVRLADDREFKAKIVGADPKTDLGVIKIDANDLVPARLGDSDRLQVGEWVLAIGSPFGLRETLTAGIVSAKGRGNVGLVDYGDFIQTDAAINPGNSGGPLVNLEGEIVGINTAIFSRSGGYMGIGFAIPVNMARHIKDRILAEGRVVRGYLGVYVQDLDKSLARSFGRSDPSGSLVSKVSPETPAAKAGLKAGDIVLGIDGVPVKNSDDLRNRVSEDRPGREVRLDVFRNGKKMTLEVKLAELPDESAVTETNETGLAADLGMEVRPITPELDQTYGYPKDVRGLIVTRVKPLSAADRAGIEPGDIVLAVQDQEVETLKDYRSALKTADLKSGVHLRLRRGKANLYVFLESATD